MINRAFGNWPPAWLVDNGFASTSFCANSWQLPGDIQRAATTEFRIFRCLDRSCRRYRPYCRAWQKRRKQSLSFSTAIHQPR